MTPLFFFCVFIGFSCLILASIILLRVYRLASTQDVVHRIWWAVLLALVIGFVIGFLLIGVKHVRTGSVNMFDYIEAQIFLWGAAFVCLCTILFHRTIGTAMNCRLIETHLLEQQITNLASFPRLSPNPIIETDRNCHVTFLNDSAKKHFPQLVDLRGSHPVLVCDAALRKEVLFGQPVTREISLDDGSAYLQTVHFLPEKDRFRVYLVDITELKWAREQWRLTESNYHELVNNLPVGVYRNTPGASGHFIEANDAIVAMFEAKDKTEFMETNVSKLYQSPGERKKVSDLISARGFVKGMELSMKTLKGRLFTMRLTAVAKKNAKGDVLYFDGIVEDVSR